MTMMNLINVSAFFVLLIFFNGVSGLSEMEDSNSVVVSNVTNDIVNLSYTNRRLLDRMGGFAEKEDIAVNQSPESPMPPYTVKVVNVCSRGCSIAQIHLACGSFTSAIEIDPKLFKRLGNDDCLVNNGNTIKAGGCVSFVYAQTSKYPMTVSSVKCVP